MVNLMISQFEDFLAFFVRSVSAREQRVAKNRIVYVSQVVRRLGVKNS